MSGEILLVLRILLAGALYAFLGWGLVTLWKDLRQQSQVVSRSRIPPLLLDWQINGSEQKRQFTQTEFILGRDPGCECPISHETVSARHARLTYHHNQWWVEDLNSTNGTFINLEPVSTPTVIVTGDEIRCGQVNIQVRMAEKPGG